MPLVKLADLNAARGKHRVVRSLVDGNTTDTFPIPLGNNTVHMTAAGASDNDMTLADGVEGQELFLHLTVQASTGDVVVTPANFVGTDITFDAADEFCLLRFSNGSWMSLATNATVA